MVAIARPLPHGYRWRCIDDPTGLFVGRVFRRLDIEPESLDDNWAEGLIFHHTKKPLTAKIINGRLTLLQEIDHEQVLSGVETVR